MESGKSSPAFFNGLHFFENAHKTLVCYPYKIKACQVAGTVSEEEAV